MPVRSLLTAALVLAGLGTPAVAAKPSVVIVPASVLATPSAKLCMPRSTSQTAAKDKSLPKTLCQTVDEWAAHGVTIRAK